MQTREIADTELPQLLALYRHLHAVDDPLPAMPVVEDVWRQLQANPNCKYFGAYVDGQLVSSCTITIILNLTRGCRPYGVIENVVTHADFRKRGLASEVLSAALAFAWAHNSYKVMLMTGRKDEATWRFYESAGFSRNDKQAFVAKPPMA